MLVTVEGIDGSGGTTLTESLGKNFDDSFVTTEPSDLWTGGVVRRCLSDEAIDPLTDFYFFMGDRIHHVEEVVRPKDEQGKLVISDRYSDSTRAYQPVALAQSSHFDSQTVAKLFLEQTMAPWNYKPDLTIYLDISIETALERNAGDEKYEKREFLEEVKKNYEGLIASESDRFEVIDGEQSKEDVLEEAVNIINSNYQQ